VLKKPILKDPAMNERQKKAPGPLLTPAPFHLHFFPKPRLVEPQAGPRLVERAAKQNTRKQNGVFGGGQTKMEFFSALIYYEVIVHYCSNASKIVIASKMLCLVC